MKRSVTIIKNKVKTRVHEIFVATDMVLEMLKVMNPTLLFDLQKYHPSAFKKINDHKNKFLYKVIRENLDKGVEEGYYRPEIDIDIITLVQDRRYFLNVQPGIITTGKA
ncbi:MAG: hypothetical protein WDO19_14890 [Bacteroidota bacterium]